jgi:ferredoxin
MVASEVFDQDDDGIVVILDEEVSGEAADHAREAVKLCPSSALSLRED